MATQYAKITKANFSTTPYHYQEGPAFGSGTWYWFYKSNVCWDVYILAATACYIRIDFYDYDRGTWIPVTSDAGSYNGFGYQYLISLGNSFRFFHNCLANYNNGAYTATIKEKDRTVASGTYTYDSRGFHLWRIGFAFSASFSQNDFNINSYGPGYLTDAEYNELCKGKKIYCSGKGDPNSDDQNIVSGNPSDSDFNTLFLPSLFGNGKLITASLDRQCIPDWKWART